MYVTYEGMFAFVMVILTVIALVKSFCDKRKK